MVGHTLTPHLLTTDGKIDYLAMTTFNSTSPKKIIVVILPKAGTTSLATFFFNAKAKIRTSHWEYYASPSVKHPFGACMKTAVASNLPPIKTCGNFDVYAQMDYAGPQGAIQTPKEQREEERRLVRLAAARKSTNATEAAEAAAEVAKAKALAATKRRTVWEECYLPQIFALEHIHKEHPEAIFILNMRDIVSWTKSVRNWSDLALRLENCQGRPDGRRIGRMELSTRATDTSIC